MIIKTLMTAAAAILITGTASAQHLSMSAEQEEVWSVIAASWVDDVEENGAWPGEYIHDEAVTWGQDFIVPRTGETWENWTRFGDENSTTLLFDISPMSITIVGDTAVANYVATTATEDSKGEKETTTGAIAETLIRVDGEWVFLSSAGFDFDL